MKFKLDENLPRRIARVLGQMGHDVHTTAQEGLTGSEDPDLWRVVSGEGRVLLTQDKDFSDVRKYRPGPDSGILVLRLHNPSRSLLMRRVLEILNTEELPSLLGATVIATKHGLRKHRHVHPAG